MWPFGNGWSPKARQSLPGLVADEADGILFEALVAFDRLRLGASNPHCVCLRQARGLSSHWETQ